MAVSKTQNERPAINALIDLANGLEITTQGQTAQISNLQSTLASEITSRENADTLLSNAIQSEASSRTEADASLEGDISELSESIDAETEARTVAIGAVRSLIGDNFSAQYTISDFADTAISDLGSIQNDLNGLFDIMRMGYGTSATVQANNYYDGTVEYETPFPETSVSFVFPAFISGVDQRDLEVSVGECDNEGFSYTVTNRASSTATFTIGYFAIGLDSE